MTKLKWILLGGMVAGIVSSPFVYWFNLPPEISEKAARVQQGMSMAEVQDILGPPMKYPLKPAAMLSRYQNEGWPLPPQPATVAYWRSGPNRTGNLVNPTTIITIGFDTAERVMRLESLSTIKAWQDPVD
jgi:hypothetical protein